MLLNHFYSYMEAVVVIDDEHGLSVEAHHINQPNKNKVSLYKPRLYSFF